MTRKTAVSIAIGILEKMDEQQEVVQVLKELHDNLPIVHWDEATIFDTINQFIEDNNRVPTATDFTRKNLPSHPTVKNRFKMTLQDFLGTYYRKDVKKDKCKYSRHDKEKWMEVYREQCAKLNNPSKMSEYDKKRDEGTPCVATLCKILGVKSWYGLLKKADVRPVKMPRNNCERKELRVSVGFLPMDELDASDTPYSEIRERTEKSLEEIFEQIRNRTA